MRNVEAYSLANVAGGDMLYVDETPHQGRGAFYCSLFPHATFNGRALWAGCRIEDGEEVDPHTPLEVASHSIKFFNT
ncbi:hypothetical protein AWB78_06483 [Caballeronia calidae]|uniref:Uncharacterized protein n=1 Tax=Caballeronia calidae TaxID=1777139 RepID=A0A158E848_9BURK|nr:hypothetical protein AWB78_06483 [Caballeronia calidae]